MSSKKLPSRRAVDSLKDQPPLSYLSKTECGKKHPYLSEEDKVRNKATINKLLKMAFNCVDNTFIGLFDELTHYGWIQITAGQIKRLRQNHAFDTLAEEAMMAPNQVFPVPVGSSDIKKDMGLQSDSDSSLSNTVDFSARPFFWKGGEVIQQQFKKMNLDENMHCCLPLTVCC